MAAYITDIAVSIDAADEQELQSLGYTKIDVNLNQGTKGNEVYLWYKKDGPQAITRVQLSYNDDMAKGLINAGYTKIDKNLNAGAGGDSIYLWYSRGSGEYDIPIVEIKFSTNAEQDARMFADGKEELACDLNRKAKPHEYWIHMLVKRSKQTYVCDVIATDSSDSNGSDKTNFKEGYIRLDEDTNRGAGGRDVYIWYRQTTDPKRAITDLEVSTTDAEYQQYEKQKYTHVLVDLNEGTRSDYKVFLWYKKQTGINPIKGIMLLLQKDAVAAYKKAGVTVIEKDLNEGNKGQLEYICVNK